LWEFKDESVLNDPRGVTVDNDGNVYVTSYSSNSVVVLEPDGRHGRQILSSDNGLENPIGISFDESKNSLIVANCCGPCFLYQAC
jgi:DNA-binding beta-propeller fold protein YncE